MECVYFPREEAKEFACKAIDEIYDHNPTDFSLYLHASVGDVPEYKITYDGYAVLKVYQREANDEATR